LPAAKCTVAGTSSAPDPVSSRVNVKLFETTCHTPNLLGYMLLCLYFLTPVGLPVMTRGGAPPPNGSHQMDPTKFVRPIWRIQSGESNLENAIWRIQSGESNLENPIWRIQSGETNQENPSWGIQSGESNLENPIRRIQSRESTRSTLQRDSILTTCTRSTFFCIQYM